MAAPRYYLAVAYADPDGTEHPVGEEVRFTDEQVRDARLADGTVVTRKADLPDREG